MKARFSFCLDVPQYCGCRVGLCRLPPASSPFRRHMDAVVVSQRGVVLLYGLNMVTDGMEPSLEKERLSATKSIGLEIGIRWWALR